MWSMWMLGLLAAISILFGGAAVRAGPPQGGAGAPAIAGAAPDVERIDADDDLATLRMNRMRLIWRPTEVAWPLAPLATGTAGAAASRSLDWGDLAARLDERQAALEGRAEVPTVRGVVSLDSARAVGVWIGALETVRVRRVGAATPLRFIRIVDGHGAVVEPGRVVSSGPGGESRWELDQPASRGGVWSIEADAPTEVIIERVEDRPARYVAVEVEHDLLRWIEAGSPDAAMPILLEPAKDLRSALGLDAALGRALTELGDGDPKLARAVEAWRMLAATQRVDRSRPAVRPYFAGDRGGPIRLAGTQARTLAASDGRRYRLAEAPRRWTLDRRGPGLLQISARAWAPGSEADTEPESTLVPAKLLVWAGGRVVARIPLSDRPARHALDPDAALPHFEALLTDAGEPVGELAEHTLVLAPGRHDYELELVGGPALIRVQGARRVESTLAALKGWTPRRRALAAERALAKTGVSAVRWLAVLMAPHTLAQIEVETFGADTPCVVGLARRSPLLAIAVLGVAAADEHTSVEELRAMVARVQPLFAVLARDPQLDPRVRGQLRARWLWLLAAHDLPELSPAIVESVRGGGDPIDELSVEGLRLLAELYQPGDLEARSRALAVLELARGRAPEDAGLRRQALRLWSSLSRWSLRTPGPHTYGSKPAAAGAEAWGPVGEWMLPRGAPAVDREAFGTGWLALEVGVPVALEATLGPAPVALSSTPSEGRRMRLFDIYVQTPVDDPSPVGIRVGAQTWVSPQLTRVQRHRIAVPPGIHEVELDGPVGTHAWTSLPPADGRAYPVKVGRRERMWSLADSAWTLPGPPVPGVVRLGLRWPRDLEPRPIEIEIHERGPEGGPERVRTIVFDARSLEHDGTLGEIRIDPTAVPFGDSPAVTLRHDLTIPIAADTTQLWFSVQDDLDIPASVALRRGLRAEDLLAGEPKGDPAELEEEAGPSPAFDALFADLPALEGEAILFELATLSAGLLADPEDLDLRARRAALLLMLGETGHARADLTHLAAASELPLAPESSPEAERRARGTVLLAELDARFEALLEPSEVVLDLPGAGEGEGSGESEGESVDGAVLLAPALAVVSGGDRGALEPWLETWASLRGESPARAVERLDAELARLPEAAPTQAGSIDRRRLVGEVARAQWLAADPAQARAASRAWLRLYGRVSADSGLPEFIAVAVAVAALDPLLVHLGDPASDGRDAGPAFGFARALLPRYAHPKVRRLAYIAARRSDWRRLDHSENNAGFERLELPVSEVVPGLATEVREALLGAPWSRWTQGRRGPSELLRPGRKGVLSWDAAPGSVSVQLWCRELRPDLATAGVSTAALRLRLRAGDDLNAAQTESLELEDGREHSVAFELHGRGRHRLEVVLGDDPAWTCSWRMLTRARARVGGAEGAAELREPRRRARWWTAAPSRGVEFVVLGPASLDIESRGVVSGDPAQRPTVLITEVQAIGTDPDLSTALRTSELDIGAALQRAVITEKVRQFQVGHPVANTIVLTEPGPHRVRLRTDRGRVVLRARVRRDRGDIPPPPQASVRDLVEAQVPVPVRPRIAALGPRDLLARDLVPPIRNRVGTLDAQARVGLDELGDVDDFRLRFGVGASLGLRRELIKNALWLRVAAQVRHRQNSPFAGGGILALRGRIPKAGLRLGVKVDVLAHRFGPSVETSVRLGAFIDRPIWLGRYLQLRPGVDFSLRWQSLSPERVAAVGGLLEPHPRVYLDYIHAHPTVLRPELELRAYPLQDLALWTRVALSPNSNLGSIDHLDFTFGVDGIGRQPGPWVPIWGVSYQISNRYFDADRSVGFVRHRVGASLGIGVWARDAVRVALGVRNQVFFSGVAPPRDVLELWIRIDGAFGRRMRDYGPGETWFGEPWAPRAWGGDDEHQARSTQGEIE